MQIGSANQTGKTYQFRRLVRWGVLFGLVFFVADRALHLGLSTLHGMTQTGKQGGEQNYLLSNKQDVLLLGDSRMEFVLMPAKLGFPDGIKVWNHGVSAQNTDYFVTVLELLSSRYIPRMVVLSADPELIYGSFRPGVFKVVVPFMDRSEAVREMVRKRAGAAYLLACKIVQGVRYNDLVLGLVARYVSPRSLANRGYFPITGSLPADEPMRVAKDLFAGGPNPEKVQALKQLVKFCRKNGVKLVLVHSPRYQQFAAHWKDELRSLLGDRRMFLDFGLSERPSFRSPRDYRDQLHLNHPAAMKLSALVGVELVKIWNER